MKRGLELIFLGVILHDRSLKRLGYCIQAVRKEGEKVFLITISEG